MSRNKRNEQVTNIQEPPVKDPGRAPYKPAEAKARRNGGGAEDPNGQPQGEDRVYGVESRDRWPGAGSVAEQHADSRAIDNGEGGDGGEGGYDDWTVDQLKTELENRGVEFKASAKKAELIEALEANDAEG